MPNKPFVFNDETKYNSYNFRTLNVGIDLTRFNTNPVMLDSHINECEAVLGRWENGEIVGNCLQYKPVFDMEDEDAAAIAGKVERGFLKGASMGLLIDYDSFVLEPNGKWLLTKCELVEGSITPVPSNAGALRLYVQKDGKLHLMADDEIKLCLSACTQELQLENKNTAMKKVILSVAALVALGLEQHNTSDGVDATTIEGAINKLKQESDTLKLKLSTAEAALNSYKQAEEVKLNAEVDSFVASVIPSKYDEAQRENITKLAKSDLAFAKKMADLVPAKASLSGKVNNTAVTTGEVKTVDDFAALPVEAQLAFKANHPDAYKKLFA
jgi:hypothetical protein